MRKCRIFLVEDDEFQREDIVNALRDGLRDIGTDAAFEIAESEEEALRMLRSPRTRREPFDIHIVDMMLPWSQQDKAEGPDDPRVMKDGPLFAGMRIVEHIMGGGPAGTALAERGRSAPVVITYTIASMDNLRRMVADRQFSNVYNLRKEDDDRALVDLVKILIEKISP